jgi:hypothetical protein
MTAHTVESTTETVRSGFLDPSAPPVVTVESCDVVGSIDDGGVAGPAFFDHVAASCGWRTPPLETHWPPV